MATYDLLVRNVRLARPGGDELKGVDIAVSAGRFAGVRPGIDPDEAEEVVDGGGLMAFPGVVDVHQHWGIYNRLEEDAVSESRACAQGGVTTGITYIRTGQYYLNRGGPYEEFLPEVLDRSEGRAYVDYAFHVAPMMRGHIDEIPAIIERFGIPSFKIFMFYGSHGLHGRSDEQSKFLMIPRDESYDYAHFEFVMRGIQEAREKMPELADVISLSLHCETAEIMTAYTKLVEERGGTGLAAYHEARPPHSEGLAVTIAAYLAHETRLANINLLHLSSAKAMEAAVRMAATFPEVDFRREVTVGHLLADINNAAGIGGKVNPPIRPPADREALWDAVLGGHVDWIVSDHACCRAEMKFGEDRDDVFAAKSGFGGTEYLLSGVYSEGSKRGLSPNRIAELLCRNSADRYGLHTKGDVADGYDADFVLFDPDETFTVHADDSASAQEYTPFEGFELTGRVKQVFLRGQRILEDGRVVGEPHGMFVRRPTARPQGQRS